MIAIIGTSGIINENGGNILVLASIYVGKTIFSISFGGC